MAFIRDASVVGRIPSKSAAPPEPLEVDLVVHDIARDRTTQPGHVVNAVAVVTLRRCPDEPPPLGEIGQLDGRSGRL